MATHSVGPTSGIKSKDCEKVRTKIRILWTENISNKDRKLLPAGAFSSINVRTDNQIEDINIRVR